MEFGGSAATNEAGVMRLWSDITPADAAGLDLTQHPEITAPVNEFGERCPWPWEPQQMKDVPIGMYHCPYCGAMVIAGLPHVDYSKTTDIPE